MGVGIDPLSKILPVKYKLPKLIHHTINFYIFLDSEKGKEQRPQSPVNQILEAIPAELYVPNQQQWISLKSGSKMATIPFCCR